MEVIKKPLYDLCYDKNKFIEYLIEKKEVASNEETISRIFQPFDDKAALKIIRKRNREQQETLGIYFDEDANIEDMMRKINYLNEEEIKILVEILTKIGFSISNFQLLINHLQKIAKTCSDKDNTPPLMKQREKLIQTRKENLQKLNEFKTEIAEFQDLKTYDKIATILDFKSSTQNCFDKLSTHREFVKEKQIFEKKFEMKELAKKLEYCNDLVVTTLEGSPSKTNLVDPFQNDIIDNWKFQV